MRIFLHLVLVLGLSFPVVAQFAPQQGLPGSTAISANSPLFTSWASDCSIHRGYINIDSPALGGVTYGDSTLAIGAADRSVVSLGDSGVAILTFPGGIYDGPGADFAVFENGFINAANDSQAFLEFAFVDVSADGLHYYRFPSTSFTQTKDQIPGSGVYSYANQVNNLAGKYIGGYGTPFDLADLPPVPGVDLRFITHVRLVDVVGAVAGSHVSHDAAGRPINDPFPTNFATGGFDLDAVGVINHFGNVGVAGSSEQTGLKAYPNPVTDKLFLDVEAGAGAAIPATITDLSGRVLMQFALKESTNCIDLSRFAPGLYYLSMNTSNGSSWRQQIIKY